MTIERRNPLPEGRYWIVVLGDNRAAFALWRELNSATVKIEVTDAEDSDPPSEFYIFNVKERVPVPGGTVSIAVPTVWDAAFGLPNVAGPEVKSRADTQSAPDLPPDATDQIEGAVDSIGSLGKTVVSAGLLIAAAILLSNLTRKANA